ncbi:tetratricopeptide repeat protein [bacterium]|nr:tetratricopeptide repeat protein [bacterium]MBU1984816.1 tetratricopeptide repeat protein [bacterium]
MVDRFWSNASTHAAAALSEGRYGDARAIYEVLLVFVEKQHGSTDLRAAGCHQGLGEALEGLGEMSQAERHLKRGLTILERRLGALHPITLRVTTGLGVFYRRNGQIPRAEMTLRKALHGWGQINSAPDLDVCETLDQMSKLYMQIGQVREAERFADKSALIRQRAAAHSAEQMLKALLDFAERQSHKRNHEETENLLKEALAITDSMRKPNNLQAAEILTWLGCLAMTAFRFEEAVSHFERTLCILCGNLGDQDKTVAGTLRLLGSAYWMTGQGQRGATCYEEALETAKRICGERSAMVAADLHKLALIYLSIGDLAKAEEKMMAALALREELHGRQHLNVVAVLKDLADIRSAQSRAQEAGELLIRVRDTLRSASEAARTGAPIAT